MAIRTEPLSIIIREPDPVVLIAFQEICTPTSYINISLGEVTDVIKCDAILLPTNERGFLDRGLSLKACIKFGWNLQNRLQMKTMSRDDFMFKPWSSEVVNTGDKDIPYTVCVPVGAHETPVKQAVGSAMRVCHTHNMFSELRHIRSICMTPSCFATTEMRPEDIASQSALAFMDYLELTQA